MGDDNTLEDEILRIECSELLNRIFPDNRNVDCTYHDVLQFLAIFRQDRYALRSNKPRLPTPTRFRTVDNLTLGVPFYWYDQDTDLINFRRYSLLLSEAFMSIAKEGMKVDHQKRDEWYEGVNKLDNTLTTTRKGVKPERSIEAWDAAFLLKHVQYLLLAMKDAYGLGDHIKETGLKALLAAIAIAGATQNHHWGAAMATTSDMARIKRSRPEWHNDYLVQLKNFMEIFDLHGSGEVVSVEELKKMELDAVTELRKCLEQITSMGMPEKRGLKNVFRKVVGETSRQLMRAGPYEETHGYLLYGLLDLLYQSTFRIDNRSACFPEIIGAIHTILEHTPDDAERLHRKAIDVYRRIKALGHDGNKEECAAIEEWMKQHHRKVDTLETSKKRWERITKEINEVVEKVTSLKTNVQLPDVPEEVPESSKFPRPPSGIPRLATPTPGDFHRHNEGDHDVTPPALEKALKVPGFLRDDSNLFPIRKTESIPSATSEVITPTESSSQDFGFSESSESSTVTFPNVPTHVPIHYGKLIPEDEPVMPPVGTPAPPVPPPATNKVYNLARKPYSKDIRNNIEFTMISATGQKVALVTDKSIHVFTIMPTVSLLCTGEFATKRTKKGQETNYKYGPTIELGVNHFQDPQPQRFKVEEISTVSLCDSYLAIGCKEMVMVFLLEGNQAGRWVFYHEFKDKRIERIKFSDDGTLLLVLLKVEYEEWREAERKMELMQKVRPEAVMFSCSSFPNLSTPSLDRSKPATAEPTYIVENVKWDTTFSPNWIAWSRNGSMVAISTTYANIFAEIRLLKRVGKKWMFWGKRKLQVLPSVPLNRHGHGFRGISFFRNDEYLALATETSYGEIKDCFRIKQDDAGNFKGLEYDESDRLAPGLRSFAIAVSPRYYAAAFLDHQGLIQIKVHGEKKLIPQRRHASRFNAPEDTDPVSMSFATNSTRLILLSYGDLEIHDFLYGELGSVQLPGETVMDEDNLQQLPAYRVLDKGKVH